MNTISQNLKFLLNISKTQAVLVKHFDKGMGNGIGFNEFLILFYLNQSDDQKMRRVDLAEKIGVTASGVTRMLLPMEKIGLIKNGLVSNDARVRLVSLSESGKQKFSDALERLEFLVKDIFSDVNKNEIKNFSNLLIGVGGKILMS
ncbi:MAG: MarR family transcriptional regulator [Candidatus Komeilibacteria bacterium]